MNTKQKAKILKAHGYEDAVNHSRLQKFAWYPSSLVQEAIAIGKTYAEATATAYQHYLAKQEAPVAETALDPASDKAWEAEFIVSSATLDTIANSANKLIKELESENAALHAENQTLLIANADLEKRIAELEAQKVNDYAYMDSLEARAYPMVQTDLYLIQDSINQAEHYRKAEQVTLSSKQPKFKVGDKVMSYLNNLVTIFKVRQNKPEFEYQVEFHNGHISFSWYGETELSPIESEAK